MKHTNLILTLIYACSILVSWSSAQQEPHPVLLDSTGQPLVRGQKYFIKSITTEGQPNLKPLNVSTTVHVGLEDGSMFDSGIPLSFSPFVGGEKMVKENKNLKISFLNPQGKGPGITWKVGLMDPTSRRRFIVTGDNVGYSNYFYIKKSPDQRHHRNHRHVYALGWCPKEICSGKCDPLCGDVGLLVEHGKKLLALDGDSLPITFLKA